MQKFEEYQQEIIQKFWNFVKENNDSVMVNWNSDKELKLWVEFGSMPLADFADKFMDYDGERWDIILLTDCLEISVVRMFDGHGVEMSDVWQCRPDGLREEW